MPPSMVVMWWEKKKLKVARSPKLPTFLPFISAPVDSQASSTTMRLCRRAISMMLPISHGFPRRCTGMMAFVFFVIAFSISRTLMLKLSRSTSTSTGTAPTCMMG